MILVQMENMEEHQIELAKLVTLQDVLVIVRLEHIHDYLIKPVSHVLQAQTVKFATAPQILHNVYFALIQDF